MEGFMKIVRHNAIKAYSGRFALRTQAQSACSSGWFEKNQSNIAIFCFCGTKHNPYRFRSTPIAPGQRRGSKIVRVVLRSGKGMACPPSFIFSIFHCLACGGVRTGPRSAPAAILAAMFVEQTARTLPLPSTPSDATVLTYGRFKSEE
jgi:hypothetical protein